MSDGYVGRKVAQLRAKVIAEYGRTCWLCGQYIDGTVSVDHVVPRSKARHIPGLEVNAIENLRPSHLECNQRRGNRAARPLPAPRSAMIMPRSSREW